MEISAQSKNNVTGRIRSDLCIDQRVRFMRSTPFFDGISEQDCIELAKLSRRRVYARDEVIAIQGQPFHTLVAIESGCVKLTRVNISGLEVIVALRGTGEMVHVPAGIPFNDHSASVQVLTGCTTLTWAADKVENAMGRLSRLHENVSRILTCQLYELQERYHDLAVEKVEVRLARLLNSLATRFGESTGGGHRLTLSRSELAQMTGTTLFTVSRLVAHWGNLGLVVPFRGAIIVLKPALLESSVTYKISLPPGLLTPTRQSAPVAVLFGKCEPKLHTEAVRF